MANKNKTKEKNTGFFGVIAKPQTYTNMLYLLLSFPLGIMYFVILTTGISLGLGLIITLIGIPILVAMMYLFRGLGNFERIIAETMFFIKIKYKPLKVKKKGLLEHIKPNFLDLYTWKSLGHLFLKFPLGIINFVFLVTFLSVSISFIATPFLYHLVRMNVVINTNIPALNFMDSYGFAILIGIVGVILFFVSLHLFNLLAKLQEVLAKELLGRE